MTLNENHTYFSNTREPHQRGASGGEVLHYRAAGAVNTVVQNYKIHASPNTHPSYTLMYNNSPLVPHNFFIELDVLIRFLGLGLAEWFVTYLDLHQNRNVKSLQLTISII